MLARLLINSSEPCNGVNTKRLTFSIIPAEPLPNNILEFHYVIRAPEDSPFNGGYYHGALMFTKEFPFKPPSIYMFTPNGRFKTNKRLCLSISDFHPDTWNPAWSISTILTGLLSFMLENTPTLGSVESTLREKQKYARDSLDFNLKNEIFCELFPDVVAEIKEKLNARREANGAAGAAKDKTMVDGKVVEANGDAGGAGVEGADNANTSTWYSLTTNLIFFLLFLIFALIVHHVLKTMNVE